MKTPFIEKKNLPLLRGPVPIDETQVLWSSNINCLLEPRKRGKRIGSILAGHKTQRSVLCLPSYKYNDDEDELLFSVLSTRPSINCSPSSWSLIELRQCTTGSAHRLFHLSQLPGKLPPAAPTMSVLHYCNPSPKQFFINRPIGKICPLVRSHFRPIGTLVFGVAPSFT
jgi:hypothetical protein